MSFYQDYDENDEILLSLNAEQREAALFKDGACLVIAGPGTGKTHTMTSRAHFLVDSGVPANSVLLMTFTKKAAKEMSARLVKMDSRCSEVRTGTFHSVAISILREHAGYEKLSIIDDEDEKEMINDYWRGLVRMSPAAAESTGEIQKAFHNAYKQKAHRKNEPVRLNWAVEKTECDVDVFTDWLNECLNTSAHAALHGVKPEDALARFFAKFDQFKKDINKFSYDDCIINATEYLKANKPDLGFRYVCIDEFQDSDEDQLEFACELADRYGNIYAVGDDKQSIYCWRGAYPRIFEDFRKMFNPVEINLVENYRSTQRVLDVVNSIARTRPLPSQELRTGNDEGMNCTIMENRLFNRDENIAQAVLEQIENITGSGFNKCRDVAVLFRHHYGSSQPLQLLLREKNIPFTVVGGKAITERKIFKRVRDCMRFVNDPSWTLPIRYLAELFPNIGASAASGLAEGFSGHDTIEKLCNAIEEGNIGEVHNAKKPGQAMIAHFQRWFLPFLEKLKDFDSSSNPVEVFDAAITTLAGGCFFDSKKTFAKYLEENGVVTTFEVAAKSRTGKTMTRAHLSVINTIREMTKRSEDVADWLDNMALDDAEEEDNRDCITLSTIHGAKGKEWPFVIVSDCCDQFFFGKHYQSDLSIRYDHERPDEDFEKWSRTAPETIECYNLFYVAASRAKSGVILVKRGPDAKLIDDLVGHGCLRETGGYMITPKERAFGVNEKNSGFLFYKENLEKFINDPSCIDSLDFPDFESYDENYAETKPEEQENTVKKAGKDAATWHSPF